jgi:terminase, large subunit
MTKAIEVGRSFLEAFRPPRRMSLSEWADEYAVLSAESSAEAGRWKTIPYQKGIMDAFTDPSVEQISVMKSARVGYTKILNHVIAYHIHQDPCSIMMVQPTIEDAEGYSKEEIAPMLRDTPCLRGLVSDAKAKDGSNNTLTKMFPGGTLGLVGANSPRGFRRVSRRVVLFDEVDGYPASAGAEGDQIKLGIRRTEYFWNRKIVAGSTPTVKDYSRIERLFGQGDQRRYFVPCSQCGHMQYLKFPNLKWDKTEDGEHLPETAHFVCEANGCVIEHKDKRSMVERGEWIPTAPGNGRHVSFHIWAAYSYSPNATWSDLVREFLEAKKDPESLKTFVNTALGETWEEDYSNKVGADGLMARAEMYTPGEAPKEVLIVTRAVDVQDNRFEISTYGWARGEESWLIDHSVIHGDPARAELWKQLDEALLPAVKRSDGVKLPVSAIAIDTGGHFTHEVYAYTRERKSVMRIIGVKGHSQRNKPAISKPTKVDVNMRGQSLKGGAEVYMIGSDTIKTTIFGRLRLDEPGPGYIHFHTGLKADFYEQLTSEKQVTRLIKGFPVREWILPPNKRNEALDCLVMNYAALQWLYTRYYKQTIWDQFAVKINKPVEKPVKSEQDEITENKPEVKENRQIHAPARTITGRGRGGFVSRW